MITNVHVPYSNLLSCLKIIVNEITYSKNCLELTDLPVKTIIGGDGSAAR
jgi:hypothetical protein